MERERVTLRVWDGVAIGLVLLLACLRFLPELHSGLGLSDEGHLWYATLRTRAGEVPIRDFRSYDPARYWWLASLSRVLGDGIVGVRAGASLFAVVGLGLGMLATRRGVRNAWLLFAVGVLCVAWMFPLHKLFEHGLLLIALYVGVRFLERPTRGAHFLVGIFAGLAACFGRNHGLYDLGAFLLLILFARSMPAAPQDAGTLVEAVTLAATGMVLGYVPILAQVLFVDGFAHSFLESILHGTGVLSKPVPWFWTFPYTRTAWLENLSGLLLGLAFLVVPLFYFAVGASLVARILRRSSRPREGGSGLDRTRRSLDPLSIGSSIGSSIESPIESPYDRSRIRLLAVCVAVGLPYLHHAYGRADASHLAQAIHPFLIGSCVLALWGIGGSANGKGHRAAITRYASILLLIYVGATTSIVLLTRSDLGERIRSSTDATVAYEVRGDVLRLAPRERDYLQFVRDFVQQNVRPDENIYFGPYRAGLYAALDRVSPVWETFFQWPVTEERQRSMIRDFDRNRVNWALVYTYAVDGKAERDPAHTMPLVWAYWQREFEPFSVPDLPKDHLCLRRRGSR